MGTGEGHVPRLLVNHGFEKLFTFYDLTLRRDIRASVSIGHITRCFFFLSFSFSLVSLLLFVETFPLAGAFAVYEETTKLLMEEVKCMELLLNWEVIEGMEGTLC